MTASPMERTLAACERMGRTAGISERRVPIPGRNNVTRDLFGFADIVAASPNEGIIFIQATTAHNIMARIEKIRTECLKAATDILVAGARIEVWGWHKRKGRGVREWFARRIRLWLGIDGKIHETELREA